MRRAAWGLVLIWGCGTEKSIEQEPAPPAQMTPVPSAEPPAPGPADCRPDEETWKAGLGEAVETFCGECHGAVPQLGAPFTLTDYAQLMVGDEGKRPVDLLAAQLQEGTMPPAAKPQPDTEARMSLIKWATCEAGEDPIEPNPGGIDSDRPVLADPGAPPEGTDFFELRADKFEVSADWDDHNECFTFQAPIGEERFIRRIETIIGDARVLHHTILIPGRAGRAPGEHSGCNGDNPLGLIYGWAPGQGALHFEEGGLRLAPGEILTLQIHYNNRAGHENVKDRSGVRIYHGPPEGPEVGMLAMGPLDFSVGPNSVGQATGWCRFPQDTKLIASFPHMHEAATAFEEVIVRADGTEEPLITLSNWSFDAQYIYDTPIDFKAGDRVRTTCTFRNETNRRLGFGSGTDDEMCFNFAYISPPLQRSLNYCNTGAPAPEVAPYAPGECAPAGADDIDVEAVQAELRVGSPRSSEGGDLPEGIWTLAEGALYVPALRLGPITIDAEATVINAQGLVAFEEGKAHLDVQVSVHLVSDTIDFDEEVAISVSGPAAPAEGNPSILQFDAECGDASLLRSLRYTTDGRRLRLVAGIQTGPLVLNVELWFAPASQ